MLSVRNNRIIILLFMMSTLFIISCAYQPSPIAYNPPGFFMGLFHGITIIISFIGSIFMDIRIYAFPNSGFFYDLGYLIGVGIVFAGIGGSTVS